MEGAESMTISHEDVGTDLRRIAIGGRLDMGGTRIVAPQLADLVATRRKQVIVDLTALELLSSIGLRALIESARTVRQRGGTMALVVDPRSIVVMSLQATGTDQVIPTFHSLAEAQKAVLG